jgi:hypothetical protein
MSFFDWPTERVQINDPRNLRRRAIASRLIQLFAQKFPTLTYRLIWESKLINAQAWRLGKMRNVHLYGGLVRHPAIGSAGLAFALAHESGHHLGGEPRDPIMKWMTWQGQADYWAAQIGMRTVFGRSARSLTLAGAAEISNLEAQLARDPDERETDLDMSTRLRIFRAGADGEKIPACAFDEYHRSCREV